MATPSQIQNELSEILADTIQHITTGIPANVKSDKVRSIHERSVQASVEILDLLTPILEESASLLTGFADPNEFPPVDNYFPGYFLQQLNPATYARVAFWIYTGVNGIGWWKFNSSSSAQNIYYGVAIDPNSPALYASKIGDFYVETTTGDSDGNVLSVWIFLNLFIGGKWIKMSSSSGEAVLYTAQTLTEAQKIQANKNIGRNLAMIDGRLYEFSKNPSNSGDEIEINDVVLNVWNGNELHSMLLLTNLPGTQFSDYISIGTSIEI